MKNPKEYYDQLTTARGALLVARDLLNCNSFKCGHCESTRYEEFDDFRERLSLDAAISRVETVLGNRRAQGARS